MEGTEIDWDYVASIGHDFTLVDGPTIGRYIYYCENCATFLMIAGGLGKIAVWHSPHGQNYMCTPKSSEMPTLKSKLDQLNTNYLRTLRVDS
jgi:hypothetical protein